MNVTDPIWETMQAQPMATAIVQGGQSVSYGALRATAEKLCTRLLRAGVQPGMCVALTCSHPSTYLVLVLALARLGAVSTPSPAWSTEARDRLLQKSKTLMRIRDNQDNWIGSVIGASQHIAAGRLFDRLDTETPWTPAGSAIGAGDTWRIALTSGSTGTVKCMAWTHEATASLQKKMVRQFDCGPGSRLLVYADMAIGFSIGHATMQLHAGGAVVFVTKGTPEEFFQILERDRPTHILSTTAMMAPVLASIESAPAGTRFGGGALRSILLGGSVVPGPMVKAIRDRLCNDLHISYGSTEMGTLALADPEALDAHPDCAGTLLPWVTGEAIDGDGAALPPGETGVLRFRSDAMASGYVGDPEANAKAFRDGWFYPGDTGSVDANRQLQLAGRSDHLINLQGMKLDPVMVESVLCAHPAVKEASVLAVTDAQGIKILVAVIVSPDGVSAGILQKMCRDRLGNFASPKVFLGVQSLPRTMMGKVDRAGVEQFALRKMGAKPAIAGESNPQADASPAQQGVDGQAAQT